jgi:putative ABC transport system permease protein
MMEWFNILMARLRALFRRESVLQDIEEELRIHVEMETETNIKRGMPPDEARSDALKSFGNPVRNTELGYDVRGGGWLEGLWQDLRYGVRMLVKSPGFTLIAVLTLALGLGANAAIFSFVNAVLLKPLPYPDPERIVSVWEKRPDEGNNYISTLNFLDWERQNRCFQFLSAFTPDTVTLTGSGSPEQLYVQRVSAPYFKALGVDAMLGRAFAASENEAGADLEVVLSNRIWQSRFGGDPKVIGRKITLDAKSYTIIGVLPANSTFDRTRVVMWLPLAFTPANTRSLFVQHWARAVSV